MTIMANHSSATTREPHVNRTTRTATIIDALKQRALAVLNDESIDAQARDIIRRALEKNDPWLARLVRKAEAGESIVDPSEFPQTSEADERKKIEALAEVICAAGDESSAALLVLMGTLQNSADPKVLANTAKHFAFTRCGELNLYGMVDEQINVLEQELFRG
jgi:hypothetical protein